jgi:peptidoglycan/xylan/chitin deacetylase (PgdA/CDA1 family)
MDGDQFVQQICSSLTDVTGHKIEPTLISNSAFDSKMTWPEIKRLVGDGHELVSHGAKHTQKFTDMFDADIQAEIIDAQNTFQVATGVRPSILTYPEGAYDERVIAAIRSSDAGIESAFHMSAGVITPKSNPMALPRVNVTQGMLTADM